MGQDRLIYLIALGVALFLLAPAGLIFYARYWNGNKYLKAQMAKMPISTIGETYKKWYTYTFKEDEERYAPKLQGVFFDKVFSPKGMILSSLLAGLLLLLIPLIAPSVIWYLALFSPIPITVAYRKTYNRQKNLEAARDAQVRRIYDISKSVLKFDPMTEYMPSSVINVQKWKDQSVPASIVIIYPTTFRADNQQTRESFESAFNNAITDENAWIYTWHPTKNAIQCRPVEDLPEKVDYKGAGPFEWHTFPLGVGLGPKGQEIVSYAVNKNKTNLYYPHILIAGTTGSGKSVIQRNIIFHCIQHNDMWRFLGVDLKRVELGVFRKYTETVLGIATTLEDGVEICRYARDIMNARYAKMEQAGVTLFLDMVDDGGKPDKAILLMIDEAFMFMSPEGIKNEEGKMRDELHAEASQLIGDIARLGRAAGVHLVLATQRPDATVIKGELKNNLDVRIAAGRLDSIPSNMVLDSQAATILPPIKGRGIVRIGGDTRQFQGFFAEQDWIDNWLSKPQNRWREPGLFKQKDKKDAPEQLNDPSMLQIPEPVLHPAGDQMTELDDFPTNIVTTPMNSVPPEASIIPEPTTAVPDVIIPEAIATPVAPQPVKATEDEDSFDADAIAAELERNFMFDDEIDEFNDANISEEEIEALLAELASLDEDERPIEEDDDTELERIELGDEEEEEQVPTTSIPTTSKPIAVEPTFVEPPAQVKPFSIPEDDYGYDEEEQVPAPSLPINVVEPMKVTTQVPLPPRFGKPQTSSEAIPKIVPDENEVIEDNTEEKVQIIVRPDPVEPDTVKPEMPKKPAGLPVPPSLKEIANRGKPQLPAKPVLPPKPTSKTPLPYNPTDN